MIRRIYDWMGTKAHSPYASWWFFILFFVEAIFFVPVDPLLILFCLERPKKAWRFAFLATVASVLGGIAAYFIGYALWETLGKKLIFLITTKETFDKIGVLYRKYEVGAVLIAGFMPMLPYKAITLTAGFWKLPLLPFIVCSFIARGARFYMVAGVIRVWGTAIKQFIDQWFNYLVLLFLGLIASSMLLLYR